MRLRVAFLACVVAASVAKANTPPPIPPDPTALAKAAELLNAVGHRDCVIKGYAPGIDLAVRLVGERLILASHSAPGTAGDEGFSRLLTVAFERQARAAIAAMEPQLSAERTERLARLLTPDQIDEARIYFTGPGGARLASETFCTVSSDRVATIIAPTLLSRIDTTIADVRQSHALMNQINSSGRRP